MRDLNEMFFLREKDCGAFRQDISEEFGPDPELLQFEVPEEPEDEEGRQESRMDRHCPQSQESLTLFKTYH